METSKGNRLFRPNHTIELENIVSCVQTQFRRPVVLNGHDGVQAYHQVWRYCEIDSSRSIEHIWQHRTDTRRVIKETCPYGVVGDRLLIKRRGKKTIKLVVTDIKVQRLGEITREEAIREGVIAWVDSFRKGPHYHQNGQLHGYLTTAFARMWDDRYGAGEFAKNPWVWVVTFHRVTR